MASERERANANFSSRLMRGTDEDTGFGMQCDKWHNREEECF